MLTANHAHIHCTFTNSPGLRAFGERMKHTFEFKLNESKGFNSYKGNIRSEYIQASFMTVEELFLKLPESVRFDIGISEFSPLQHLKKKKLRKLTLIPLQRKIECSLKLMIGEWPPTL